MSWELTFTPPGMMALLLHAKQVIMVMWIHQDTEPAYAAACLGQRGVFSCLIEALIIKNCCDSPLMAPELLGHRDTSVLLVNVGADLQQCLRDSASPDVNHPRDEESVLQPCRLAISRYF